MIGRPLQEGCERSDEVVSGASGGEVRGGNWIWAFIMRQYTDDLTYFLSLSEILRATSLCSKDGLSSDQIAHLERTLFLIVRV